ncbi:MAG: hypothetical protein JSS38_04300 [Nitrospira sp.]|nr:hypothetical protein [Nitrospira sp.]MBS0164789.1 hypothetical protein [Nitrospira sp.]
MKRLLQSNALSRVDVTHISTHGIWLLTTTSELFVSFIDFPKFRTASSSSLMHVARLHPDSLYWPDLDIEIPIKHVRCFPLAAPKLHPIKRSGLQTKTKFVAV